MKKASPRTRAAPKAARAEKPKGKTEPFLEESLDDLKALCELLELVKKVFPQMLEDPRCPECLTQLPSRAARQSVDGKIKAALSKQKIAPVKKAPFTFKQSKFSPK